MLTLPEEMVVDQSLLGFHLRLRQSLGVAIVTELHDWFTVGL